MLYTGSAVVAGEDLFRHRVARTARAAKTCAASYQEIDPDVFGEELVHPPYDRADRIAVVAVTVERRSMTMGIGRAGWTRGARELDGPRFAEFQTGPDGLQRAPAAAGPSGRGRA